MKNVERPPARVESFVAKSEWTPRHSLGLQCLAETEFFNRIGRQREFRVFADS